MDLCLIDGSELVDNLMLFPKQYTILVQLPDLGLSIVLFMCIFFNVGGEVEIFPQVGLVIYFQFIVSLWLLWMHFQFSSFRPVYFYEVFVSDLEFLKAIVKQIIVLRNTVIAEMESQEELTVVKDF